MVFEKLPDKKFCLVCNGPHIEEHPAHRLEQAIIQLTGMGKVLPATVLGAALFTIFFYTVSVSGIIF